MEETHTYQLIIKETRTLRFEVHAASEEEAQRKWEQGDPEDGWADPDEELYAQYEVLEVRS